MVMNSSNSTHYIAEQQFWFIATAVGFILAAFSSSLLFIWFGLQVLGLTTNIAQLGVTGIGVALIVSILLTRIIANRLLKLGMATISSIALIFSNGLLSLDNLDPEEAEGFCTTGHPFLAFAFPIFGAIFIGGFKIIRWTCDTARPEGGVTHATCVWYEPSLFREVLLEIIRLMGGGLGIAGLFLFAAFVLELKFLWRDSVFQVRYQSSPLYDWLHPMNSFYQNMQKKQHDEED
jgi:hypothetical protein